MANTLKDKAERAAAERRRKDMAKNPVEALLSQAQEEEQAEEEQIREPEHNPPIQTREAPAQAVTQEDPSLQAVHYTKRAPQGREAKSRRLQLLITPSLYQAVKERADAEGCSVNETISDLLQTALRWHDQTSGR